MSSTILLRFFLPLSSLQLEKSSATFFSTLFMWKPEPQMVTVGNGTWLNQGGRSWRASGDHQISLTVLAR